MLPEETKYGRAALVTRAYRISGIVQGVGFRPFVYRLANRHRIKGWVLNDSQGVLLAAQGQEKDIDSFMRAIHAEQPPLARIAKVQPLENGDLAFELYPDFKIRSSQTSGEKRAVVPPDSNVCGDCLAELLTPDDRRFRYPFITCTNCGPRFSIIKSLPYDRANTTMAAFEMCDACGREYSDPDDRRYHAQPNGCPVCGPQLTLSNRDGAVATGERAVELSVEALRNGGIVAVKSVGGFHLAVDATNGDAVKRLRLKKRRDAKPFAVMVGSLQCAQRYAECLPHEAELLESPARPIVLLKRKRGALPESIAPNNPNLGIMLASAPLHYLLLDPAALPVLVMTSGNVSGFPIAYRNQSALNQLFEVADLILHHDRDIETRVDDSVVRCSAHPKLDRPLVSYIRKSRGYAPYRIDLASPSEAIVALGAELKTTVALAGGDSVFVSQHIGDLKNDDVFRSHQECADHLSRLYGIQPDWVACDMHPSFRSAAAARGHGEGRVIRVQHHHAHMASCIVENHLEGQTIGVIFDGAGYGLDGSIWGGEFLVGDCESFRRAAHLRPIQLLGGDKAVHEPIRSAFSLVAESIGEVENMCSRIPAFAALTEQQRKVYAAMFARKINTVPASSMGRLFDGVAALLGLCGQAEYEAQGPIEMEALLERDMSLAAPYAFHFDTAADVPQIDYRPTVRDILSDLLDATPPARISRRFHSTIAAIVIEVCNHIRGESGLAQVVLSGGVFLNEFVLVNALIGLRDHGFSAHCHRAVPTNDGGISLGQIAVANARLKFS